MFNLRRRGEHKLFFLRAYDFAGLTEVDERYLDSTQIYLDELLRSCNKILCCIL